MFKPWMFLLLLAWLDVSFSKPQSPDLLPSSNETTESKTSKSTEIDDSGGVKQNSSVSKEIISGNVGDTLPDTDDTLPDTDDTLPDTDDTLPDTDDTLPDTDDTLPDTDDTLPDMDDTLPDTDDTLPDTDDNLPDTDDTLPDTDDTLPDQDHDDPSLLTETSSPSTRTLPENNTTESTSSIEPASDVDFPTLRPPPLFFTSDPVNNKIPLLRSLNTVQYNINNKTQSKGKSSKGQKSNNKAKSKVFHKQSSKLKVKEESSKTSSSSEKIDIENNTTNKNNTKVLSQVNSKIRRVNRRRRHRRKPKPNHPPYSSMIQHVPGANSWSNSRPPLRFDDPYFDSYPYPQSFPNRFSPYYDQHRSPHRNRNLPDRHYSHSSQYNDHYPMNVNYYPSSFQNGFSSYYDQYRSPYHNNKVLLSKRYDPLSQYDDHYPPRFRNEYIPYYYNPQTYNPYRYPVNYVKQISKNG